MAEKESLFKFKKAIKTIGGVDVNNVLEYDIFKKEIPYDLPSFAHVQKMWNVIETPDVTDADGNVTTPGVKATPSFRVVIGFIKDDKFIVQRDKTYTKGNFHEIKKVYSTLLESLVGDEYKLDESYRGVPVYYQHEKADPMSSTMNAMMQAMNIAPQSVTAPSAQPASNTSGIKAKLQVLQKMLKTNP